MQAYGVEIVCGPSESTLDDREKLGGGEVPPRRVGIEAAQVQCRLIIPAAEIGVEWPLNEPSLKTALLQPVAASARLVAADLAAVKKKTGFDVFVFDRVEVVQEEFHFVGIGIRERRHGPKIGVAQMTQAQHPQVTGEKLHGNA